MNNDERICSIALTLCPGVGSTRARVLMEGVGSASAVFERRQELPSLFPGMPSDIVEELKNPQLFRRAEVEMEFAEKKHIACLTMADEAYPSRLRSCPDAPLVLFYKGTADLNNLHIVSIVGTRQATDYGKQFCANFLHRMAELCPDMLVVSGLAYGIDIHAHRAALASGLETVAVLAHGLDRIYPQVHRRTAVEMTEHGGLLTEFLTGTEPERFNFVQRNRIVAGMSDATVVVESAAKGGSLITAELANDYDRSCFALPGRSADPSSEGCNKLIHDNRATLLLSAEDFMKDMKWGCRKRQDGGQPIQRSLFADLSEDEAKVVRLLKERGDLHINTLTVETNIAVNLMSGLLFDLEMKGMVKPLVGGTYHLL